MTEEYLVYQIIDSIVLILRFVQRFSGVLVLPGGAAGSRSSRHPHGPHVRGPPHWHLPRGAEHHLNKRKTRI